MAFRLAQFAGWFPPPVLCVLSLWVMPLSVASHVWPDLFPTTPETFGMSSRFVTVDGGVALHVVDRPGLRDDLGPYVLVHGWPDSWRSFQRIIPLLGPERRIIALDQRGFGLSSKPEASIYGMQTFAEDLGAVLDALDVQQVGCLIGHSMGSFVSWHFASSSPERVDHLVLIGTGPSGMSPSILPIRQMVDDVSEISYPFTRDFQYSTFYNVTAAGDWFLQTIVHESMQAPMHAWKAGIHGLTNVTREEGEERVPRITAPTLLIRGSADALFSAEDQDRMLELLHQGWLVEVSHAGHSVQWEEHGAWRVVASISHFLATRARESELSSVEEWPLPRARRGPLPLGAPDRVAAAAVAGSPQVDDVGPLGIGGSSAQLPFAMITQVAALVVLALGCLFAVRTRSEAFVHCAGRGATRRGAPLIPPSERDA